VEWESREWSGTGVGVPGSRVGVPGSRVGVPGNPWGSVTYRFNHSFTFNEYPPHLHIL
jgi:hypothetical protein